MKPSSIKIGIPTMFMILFSLCLIIFSVLSFVSAMSDYKLTSKLLERTASYYEQCNKAEEYIPNVISDEDVIFPIDDSQGLLVSYKSNGSFIEIASWKIINLSEDVYDDHLNVIQ